MPARELEEDEAVKVANGVGIESRVSSLESHVRLVRQGRLLAIAEPDDDRLKPTVVFK
jgi:hypothetical protein